MFSASDAYREMLNAALPKNLPFERLSGATILVTGATGLIGAMLVDSLMALPKSLLVSVRAGARGLEKARLRFLEHLDDPRFAIVPFDMNEALPGDQRFDYIVHAASNAHPRAYAEDPAGTLFGCVASTRNLLDYGLRHGLKRFLYVSSGEVYGEAAGDEGFSENDYGYVDILASRACYPMGKRASETLISAYIAQYGADAVVARPSHTYGPTQTAEDSRASAQFLRAAARGEGITLKSAGGQMRSYLHAADCAAGIWTALLLGNCGEAYNVANPEAIVTVAQLAREIAKAAQTSVSFAEPDKAEALGYTPNKRGVLIADKLMALGFRPVYTVPEGVSKTLLTLTGKG